VQKHVLVDLVKSFPTNICLQKSASMPWDSFSPSRPAPLLQRRQRRCDGRSGDGFHVGRAPSRQHSEGRRRFNLSLEGDRWRSDSSAVERLLLWNAARYEAGAACLATDNIDFF